MRENISSTNKIGICLNPLLCSHEESNSSVDFVISYPFMPLLIDTLPIINYDCKIHLKFKVTSILSLQPLMETYQHSLINFYASSYRSNIFSKNIFTFSCFPEYGCSLNGGLKCVLPVKTVVGCVNSLKPHSP